MNPKFAHKRSALPRCLWGTVAWLALLSPLSAQPYYLLSELAPIWSNPYPNAPMLHVIYNIWLIDDTGFTPPDKFKTKWTAEQARAELLAAFEKRAASDAAQALTNPPAASRRSATNLPPDMKRIRYGGSEMMVTTKTNMGDAIQFMEQQYPGISTNFSPEQLRLPPPETNQWWKTAKRIPPHINKASPTFEEDFAKWKKENGFTNRPPTHARTNAIPL